MSTIDRRPIFQAVRMLRGGQGYTLAEVRILDVAIDAAFGIVAAAPAPCASTVDATGHRVSAKGITLIHSFEQCRLEAYPDPGSRNGDPWTIGWGSTGADIMRGTRWTQAEADARFEADLARFSAKVEALLGGSATTQHQFDALVSLAYNIGTGALAKSTVLRRHRAGDPQAAARAFLMWNKNDGKVMRGLTRRRMAEADHYDDPDAEA